MGVAPQCKSASIRFANQVLDEFAEAMVQAQSFSFKAGPAMLMIDATGRLPMEGMLSDYYPIVGQDACGILAALLPIIDCTNPAFQNFEIKLPIGYSFNPGNSIACQNANGKHCVAIYLPMSPGRSNKFKEMFELPAGGNPHSAIEMLNMLKQKKSFLIPNFENLHENFNIANQMFDSAGGKLALEYLMKNPVVRSILSENSELISSLQNLNLLHGMANSTGRMGASETTTINPIIEIVVEQIVKLFITIWAGAQQPLGFGQCVPVECVYSDIGSNLNTFFATPAFNTFDADPYVANERYFCVDNNIEFDWNSLDTFISVVFIGLAFFLVLGTFIDVLQQIFNDPNQNNKNKSIGLQVILSFSMYTNFKKIISTREGGGDTLSCLHGMRFLSMSWVLLGHSFIFALGSLFMNNGTTFQLKAFTGEFGLAFQAVVEATPSVDSFFLFSGLLVSYLLLKDLDKSKGRFKLVMFYVHRYIRLTIPLAFITAFYILILPVVARLLGTQRSIAIALSQKEACTQWGWANLVYLNNFYKHGNDCIGVTWYTCDDMIFFWISPLIIYPMWSNSSKGALTWWFLWLIGATFPSIYETWTFRLGIDGNPLPGLSDNTFLQGYGALPDFYRQPWTRFQPYLIGLLLGYLLHKSKGKQFQMSKTINAIGWQAAFLCGFAVVYGPASQYDRYPLSNLEYTLYNGFQRVSWSFALSWVIFSCTRGYGGMINDLLSWKFFLPLSRISFMTYLIHTFFIFIVNGYFSTFAVNASLTLMVGLYLSHLICSMALALLLTLAFESPFIRLEKLLIGAMLRPASNEEKMKPV